MAAKRQKHKLAALVCNREGGKSEAKVHDVAQAIDIMSTMMSEEMLSAGSDLIRTEVVDFLETDARAKYRKLRTKAQGSKARKK